MCASRFRSILKLYRVIQMKIFYFSNFFRCLTSHALKLKRKKVKLAKTIFEQPKILKMINNPKQRNKTVSTTNISCFNLLFFNYFIMYHPKCGSLNIDPQ